MQLFDVNKQFHHGVDVAADIEGSRRRKGFGNILARVPLIAVEGKARRLDINLIDELVIVSEGQAFATVYIDLRGAEVAAFLNDGMGLVGGKGRGRNEQEQREQFFHRVTT